MTRVPLHTAITLLAIAAAPAMIAQTHEVQAGALRVKIATRDGRFYGLSVRERVSGRNIAMKEAFVIVL
jgi:hypothetical protein